MNGRWISSLEIIDKTGISRATLNNYIRLNILPRPQIKKPVDKTVRARMLGYFPEDALAIVEQIKAMKREGNTLEMIVDKLKQSEPPQTSLLTDRQPETESGADKNKINLPRDGRHGSGQKMGAMATRDADVIGDLFRQRMPALVSFSVLVADLHDRDRICAEMPPEEYFELMSQIWSCMEGSFKHYGCIFGKYREWGAFCFFLRERDDQYIANALACAIKVREDIKEINAQWKMRRGWFTELHLNIGINEGQEFIGTINTASLREFAALGDTVNHAGRLSDFARRGAIWTTKNLINRLNAGERSDIRYGIRHFVKDDEVFIENSFGRIMDMMPSDNVKKNKFDDIEALIVTEILNRP